MSREKHFEELGMIWESQQAEVGRVLQRSQGPTTRSMETLEVPAKYVTADGITAWPVAVKPDP